MNAPMPPRPRPRLFLAVIGAAVSLLFGYLAVRNVQWSAFWEGLRTCNYWWLVPSLAVLVLTVFVKAVRWQFLFGRATRPPLLPVTASLLIGHFFNSVLPARAGEAARVVALRMQARTSAVEAAGTIVSERILDVLALLGLLFVASPFLPDLSWIAAAVALAGLTLACSVLLVVLLGLFGNRPFRAVARFFARLPGIPLEPLEQAADNLVEGLAVFRQPRIAAAAVPLTLAAWLSLALSFWLVMIGFGLEVGFGAALLVVIATNLVLILPSSPAAVGVFEAATLVALKAYGVDDSSALSYAIVVHAANVLPFVLLGYVALHWHVRSLRLARQVSTTSPAVSGPIPTPPHG